MSKTPRIHETDYSDSKYFRVAEAITDVVEGIDYRPILDPGNMNIRFNPTATKSLFRKTCWVAYERRGIAEYSCFRAEYNARQKTLKVYINSAEGWKLQYVVDFCGNVTIFNKGEQP